MKTVNYILAALLLFAVSGIKAATLENNTTSHTITVKAAKVSKILVERWIQEYCSIHPEVNIMLVGNNEEADLTLSLLNNEHKEDNLSIGETIVGRYAILPVTSSSNPLLTEVEKKSWTNKDLKRLFFQNEENYNEEGEETSSKDKLADRLVVFSGNNKNSASSAFASHFGYEKNDLRGKRIAGDDAFLLSAIKKDAQGVTFNSLTYLFDLQSRSLKTDIALLPLSVKKEQAEVLRSGNLDKTIELLEEHSIESIPVDNIGFTYTSFNKDIDTFLTWVISEGQKYNHQAGFLRLVDKDSKAQLKLLAER